MSQNISLTVTPSDFAPFPCQGSDQYGTLSSRETVMPDDWTILQSCLSLCQMASLWPLCSTLWKVKILISMVLKAMYLKRDARLVFINSQILIKKWIHTKPTNYAYSRWVIYRISYNCRFKFLKVIEKLENKDKHNSRLIYIFCGMLSFFLLLFWFLKALNRLFCCRVKMWLTTLYIT